VQDKYAICGWYKLLCDGLVKRELLFEGLAFEAVLVVVALNPNLFVQRPSGEVGRKDFSGFKFTSGTKSTA